ncbi:MAG: hypothetical protein KBF73_04815, partial [Flavobacteriales bacterium]|nr:hypothetical protein [Flavobacteriales bacterium]
AIELDPKEPLPWLQLGLFQIRAASNPKTHDLFPFTHNDGCKSLKTAIELGSKDAKKEFEKYCK